MNGNSSSSSQAPLPPAIVLRGLFDGFPDATEEEFVAFYPGVAIRPLYGFGPDARPLDRSAPSAALLRYAPGASVPLHRHPGFEHILILSGGQQDDRGSYGPGTCLISTPGSEHRVSSSEGCLALAIWTQSVEVVDADSNR